MKHQWSRLKIVTGAFRLILSLAAMAAILTAIAPTVMGAKSSVPDDYSPDKSIRYRETVIPGRGKDYDYPGGANPTNSGDFSVPQFAWMIPPLVPWYFNRPEGIAVDGSGNIYVADTSNHRIQKFDAWQFSGQMGKLWLRGWTIQWALWNIRE